MLKGIDLSNHQGPPSSYRHLDWYVESQFVIAQAIRPPQPFAGWEVGGYTEAQLRAAKEDGKYIGIYVWLWNTLADTKADIRGRLSLIPDDLALDIRPYLDVEDVTANTGPSRQQDVLDALEIMDEWGAQRGLPSTGLYSGDWYIQGYMGGWFPENRMYWLADYGLAPEVLPMRPIHQYASSPVDMNVMLESEIVTQPPREPEPTPDVDLGWQAKKNAVVGAAGELQSVSGQLTVEANRKGGPRVTVVRKLALDVKARADLILN